MYQKTVLDSGVILVSERIPSRTVSFGIWIDAGTRDEDEHGSGAAHFLEHMLFKGTGLRDASAIARELDRLGGLSNAFTTKENTCLYGTVLDSQLSSLVTILSELFFDSLLPDHEIERERMVILQEIGMSLDTPEDLIHDLFAGVMWEGHSMSRPVLGRSEVIAAMDRDLLQAFKHRGYRPGRVLVSAAGNVDHHALVGMLSAMNDWRPASLPGAALPARIAPSPQPPKVSIYPKRLEQAHVLLGTPGPPASTESRYVLSL
ncbi:MAG: pitrilysin family protein, partial [Desulfobulbaceae bacterium]|nr:pitrilysin family protein [Desulfobulbaceae bacterium]